MVNLVCLLAKSPNGLLEKVISLFNSTFGNYVVAIIMIALVFKIIQFPIDFLNKRSNIKTTEEQIRLQPKVENIKRKYPDKNIQNQKINELYKKEGFNPGGSCLIVLVSLVLSTMIFLGMFNATKSISAYKVVEQYEQLQVAYVKEYVNDNTLDISNLENINQIIVKVAEDENYSSKATTNVKLEYSKTKESFLWIENIWFADSPNQKAIPSFKTYLSLANISFENTEEGKAQKIEAEKAYNAVMGGLEKQNSVNGYFILPILAALTAFLYQYLSTKKNNPNKQQGNQKDNQNTQPQAGKTMLFITPILMLIFTLNYTSIFSIYLIIGQVINIATVPIINYLLNLKVNKKVESTQTVIDIEPATETIEVQNNKQENKTKNQKTVSKKNKNTKAKGKAIKYPKKTNKGV